MVVHLIFLLFFLPLSLYSGEFIASVNRNEVNLGESLNLHLTLTNASPKNVPSLAALQKDFYIQSQQQSNQTNFINGKVSSNISWNLTIIPTQKEGIATIPSITIDSTDGPLSTQPITIIVSKNTASNSGKTEDVNLSWEISNAKPYKNEPVIYTIKLISKNEMANIKMQKLEIEDAIIEAEGEPKIYKKVIKGVNTGIIEFSYVITPLKSGPLKIPSSIIQGLTPGKQRKSSFLDDDFDLFSNFFHGFDRFVPFTVMTEELVLEVLPPIPGINPWIPARSLTIEESFNENQLFQKGEPISRTLSIQAEGIKSSQLPNLAEIQANDSHFKVYTDHPQVNEEINGKIIKSSRKQEYTLIPQESGSLTLPEISIAWWDVIKKEKVITKLPARSLNILASPEKLATPPLDSPSLNKELAPVPQAAVTQMNPLLYAIIAGMALLLIGAFLWGISLQKKILRMTDSPIKEKKELSEHTEKDSEKSIKSPNNKDKKEKLPELNPT